MCSSDLVYNSPTQLYLTDVTGQIPVAYAGSTNNAAGWQTITYAQAQAPGWLGYFWQPYMTGILNQAYGWVAQALATSDPTNASNAGAWALQNAVNLGTIGMNYSVQASGAPYTAGNFTTNGPYYAVGITCPNGSAGAGDYNPGACDYFNIYQTRELNSETLNVATSALSFFPDSLVALNLGNTMIESMYAQSGEEGFDGTNVLYDMVNPGYLYTGLLQHKWFGAFWGVGSDWAWQPTRLGGLRPPIPQTASVPLDFQGAAKAVLTVTRPDGTSSQVTCTSSPCSVSVDKREGVHLGAVKYLNSSGRVLRTSSLLIPIQ